MLTGNIADNSLTSADLGTNSVGGDEVADNAIGQSEIRNNGVSASEIADNSIDGGEIVDGSLSVRDVARQVGTLQWPVPLLGPDKCDVKPVPEPVTEEDDWAPRPDPSSAEMVAHGVRDLASAPVNIGRTAANIMVISPTSPWPAELVYTVNGTSSETEFKVQACNRSGKDIAGATYAFNYAVIGF